MKKEKKIKGKKKLTYKDLDEIAQNALFGIVPMALFMRGMLWGFKKPKKKSVVKGKRKVVKKTIASGA